MRDYKRALTKLIQHLRANPPSTGIIVGYTLGQSRRALKLGVHERLVEELPHSTSKVAQRITLRAHLIWRGTYRGTFPYKTAES